MANARIALAICWDCCVGHGLWGAGGWDQETAYFTGPQWALRPARGGSMAGPVGDAPGDALHCMPMHGLHLTADLHGCRCAALAHRCRCLGRACLDAVAASGLQAVGQVFTPFLPRPTGPAA